VREPCATCEMGYVRATYVFLMRLFLVHIDRHIVRCPRLDWTPNRDLAIDASIYTYLFQNQAVEIGAGKTDPRHVTTQPRAKIPG